MHGYDATESKVVFINSNVLENQRVELSIYVTFGAGLKQLAANLEETKFRFQRRNQQMFLILVTSITR
jgi:hypothetical protein